MVSYNPMNECDFCKRNCQCLLRQKNPISSKVDKYFKRIIEIYTSSSEEEAFGEFLWWENFKETILSGSAAVERWNKRMGHIFMISEAGNPYEDIPKMIEVWRRMRDE